MRYIKIRLSFGDKLRLLFLGVVPEDKIPEVVKIVQSEKEQAPEMPTRPPFVELSDEINTKEPEKLDIPFFDLGDDDVKSNF